MGISLALILVAGLAVLIWLGNLNTDYGIGGPTIIILVSMLRNWPTRFLEPLVQDYHGIITLLGWLLAFILLLLVSFLIFRFYQGERRLPLMHVMLDDRFAAQSYLPIPMNPAGNAFYVCFQRSLISAVYSIHAKKLV
ncbi:hypothetical protein AAFF39_10930 [Lactococcus garvieae]